MRRLSLVLVLLLLLSAAPSALAGQLLNIYIDKADMLAYKAPASDIRIRPEGMVRVTRHFLWPWDESGSAYSLFVELENTSEEKIVIDEDWLYACTKSRKDIAEAAFALDYTVNVIHPGERIVVHAGIKDWRAPTDYHDVTNFETISGLSSFASAIRKADILRLRFDTRGSKSTREAKSAAVSASAWIENGSLFFEAVNHGSETAVYYQTGVIVSDASGSIIDILSASYANGAVLAPGETLLISKPLQPYITEEMAESASYEIFAYTSAALTAGYPSKD